MRVPYGGTPAPPPAPPCFLGRVPVRGGHEPLLRPPGRRRPILMPAFGPIRGGVSLHHAADGALSGLRQICQLPSFPASKCTSAGGAPFRRLQAHAPVLHHSGWDGMLLLLPDGCDEQRAPVQGTRRALPLPGIPLSARLPHRKHTVPHLPGRLCDIHGHSLHDLRGGKTGNILYGQRSDAGTPAGKLQGEPSTTRNNRSTANLSKKMAIPSPPGYSRDAGSRETGNRLSPAESRTCRTGSLHPCPGRLLRRKPVPEHPESERTRQFPST